MYARVLRKWSLAKFLMYLWLLVIMLLVICCQNATSMHLVRNARSSRSTSSSHTLASSPIKTMPQNSDLGSSTMTIYSPYGQFVDPYRNQFNQQLRRESYNARLDELQQPQQQLSIIDGIQQRQYYSPYTIYIRTNAETAQVNRNVPNMNSQIINLNSNSYASSTFSNKERIESAPQQQDDRGQILMKPITDTSSSNLRFFGSSPRQYTLSHRGKYRERPPSQNQSMAELSLQTPRKSAAEAAESVLSEPPALDPMRAPVDWQSQKARKLRIERHRQRRHRHFEQIARDGLNIDPGVNQHSNSTRSSPAYISTSTISLSNTTTITANSNIKDKSDDNSPSYKSFDSQSGTLDVKHSSPIVNSQNRMITFGGTSSVARMRRMSHHNRRRKRYCSARDPVQLAYLAPIVLEGKVRSMSTNRRANFSVTFEVTQIFKNRQNHNIRKHDLVRLQFTFSNTTGGDCGDIYQERFRQRGLIRRDLQNGRNYTLFLKYDGEKFQILGEPTMSTQRVYGYVKNASQEKFGKPASIKSLTANKNKVREKEELRIVCIVRGNPPPKITWFKDDKSIKQNRQQYQFNNRKRRSELIVTSFSNVTAGLYECRAKNRVMVNRKVEKKTIRIEAYGRPESHNDTGEECGSSMKAYCLNGGICWFFSDISQYYCKCAEGFEGDRCQEKRPTNVSLNQTVTGYMADSPSDTMSEESEENFSLSSSTDE